MDFAEGGSGGPYAEMRAKDNSKKPSVYMNRPPMRSVASVIKPNKDGGKGGSIVDTSAISGKGEISQDSPEMLKYKAKKTQKEKTL